MYDMAWAPAKNTRYWSWSASNPFTYMEGRIYIGMPYTQRNRRYNLARWLTAVKHTKIGDYYKVTMPGVSYPGNDCSSFVSICQFGMNTKNSYLNTSEMYSTNVYKTVKNGFASLMPGDLLVKRGHVAMFLYYVNPDRIMVLEQGGVGEPNTVACSIKTISGTYSPQRYRVRRKATLPSA